MNRTGVVCAAATVIGGVAHKPEIILWMNEYVYLRFFLRSYDGFVNDLGWVGGDMAVRYAVLLQGGNSQVFNRYRTIFKSESDRLWSYSLHVLIRNGGVLQ